MISPTLKRLPKSQKLIYAIVLSSNPASGPVIEELADATVPSTQSTAMFVLQDDHLDDLIVTNGGVGGGLECGCGG